MFEEKAARWAENRSEKQAERSRQPRDMIHGQQGTAILPAAPHRFTAWSFLFVVDDYEAPKRSAWEITEASFLENTL